MLNKCDAEYNILSRHITYIGIIILIRTCLVMSYRELIRKFGESHGKVAIFLMNENNEQCYYGD